jgi:hypothetical protein
VRHGAHSPVGTLSTLGQTAKEAFEPIFIQEEEVWGKVQLKAGTPAQPAFDDRMLMRGAIV